MCVCVCVVCVVCGVCVCVVYVCVSHLCGELLEVEGKVRRDPRRKGPILVRQLGLVVHLNRHTHTNGG